MQLIIQNFGPIKQGKIDLTKKFYLFVGYNNTGKTYVSQLLWGIFNEETIENFSKSIDIPELNLDKIKEKLEENAESAFDITPEIIDKILGQFALFLKHKLVPKIFNIDKQHFILEQFSVEFEYDINRVKKRDCAISSFLSSEVLITTSKEKDSLTVKFTPESVSKEWLDVLPKTSHRSLVTICSELIMSLLFNTHHQPVFLPSSRIFYPLFYSYIYRAQKEKYDKVSKLVGEALEKKKKGEPIDLESFLINGFESDYTEPMNLLFEKLYRLNEDMTVQNHYEHLVSEMTTILGGDIIMSKKEGIAPIKFGFKPSQHDNHLPMFLSSSSVNQLSTLYLYFKYWAQKEDNFLMVDEPEENLHPKNQMALLNVLLAYAQTNNNKVLIITHSPLLADAVNNYLYLFWLKSQQVDVSKIVEDYYPEINPDINLSTDDIAIYFFEGTRIIPYKRGDYGVLFSDFDAERRKIKKIELALTEKMYQLLNADEEY